MIYLINFLIGFFLSLLYKWKTDWFDMLMIWIFIPVFAFCFGFILAAPNGIELAFAKYDFLTTLSMWLGWFIGIGVWKWKHD